MLFPSTRIIHRFQSSILDWFLLNRRNFPWRRTQDPYKILLAEFMLQRTGAPQTVPVYRSFTRQYPKFRKLLRANASEVSAILRPLGRTGRSQQLLGAVKTIDSCFKGKLPRSENHLLQIPGVGKYTARAIMVFAYGRKLGLFDPNISRVLNRAFGLSSKKKRPHTDASVWEAVDRLAPSHHIREYNWALLDLASKVCVHKNQKCAQCPIASVCHTGLKMAS